MMRKAKLLVPLAFALLLLPVGGGDVDAVGFPTRQWKEHEIDKLKRTMWDLHDIAKTTRGNTANTVDAVQGLVAELEQTRSLLDDRGREFVEMMAEQGRQIQEGEVARLQEFLRDQEDVPIRNELKALVTEFQSMLNDQISFSFSVPCMSTTIDSPRPLDLDAIRALIDDAPAIAFYPIYRLRQIAPDLLDKLRQLTACAREAFAELGPLVRRDMSHADVAAQTEFYYDVVGAVNRTGWVLVHVGEFIETLGATSTFENELAVWGWVGGSVKVEIAQPTAMAMQAVGGFLQSISESALANLQHSEIVHNQQQILANQDLLLAR